MRIPSTLKQPRVVRLLARYFFPRRYAQRFNPVAAHRLLDGLPARPADTLWLEYVARSLASVFHTPDPQRRSYLSSFGGASFPKLQCEADALAQLKKLFDTAHGVQTPKLADGIYDKTPENSPLQRDNN